MRSFELTAAAFAAAAVLAGGIVLALRPFRLPRRHSPDAVVPWSAVEVIAGFFAFVLVPAMLFVTLESLGFFRLVYGPDFPPATDAGRSPAQSLRQLWVSVLGGPLCVVAVLVVVRESSGTSPRDLGFRFDSPRHDIADGYILWLALTPVVFAVFLVTNLTMWYAAGVAPDDHTLTKLVPNADSLTWTLFGVQVMLVAPLTEEVLFRGLLLPWVAAKRDRVLPCVIAAAFMAYLTGERPPNADEPAWLRYAPLLWVLLLSPLVFATANRPRTAGVLASAVLFAALHSAVWPTPIPLFFLGVGLGWLALRTRSLIGPIVAHGLFNAVSFAALWFGERAG